MAIGYIKKKMVEGVETLVPETTAGPSAGTVRKLSFDCNIDYAVPITADETGEGYIGVSGNCKLSFNPKFNIGTAADPEYIGVLKADCFCGKGTNTEIADCVEIGEVCQNLNYKVPFTCNCEVLTACSQNLLFNPNTGLLCSNCMCIANNLEVLCDVCADEYKSRTAGVGITVDTTAEDDTLNHNGDVIYKGCDGELATSSCKDFKYNPSTGTLTVDHICSCDITSGISNSKLCDSGQFCICYCSSATAEDYGAVEMHAYCCNLTSSELSEGCASLAFDGFHVSCVPFCQSDGSGSTYTCAKIGNGCDIWESQVCLTDCTRAYRCGRYDGLCEGVKVTDSNGNLCCGIWTDLTASTGLFTNFARKTSAGLYCSSMTLGSGVQLASYLVDSSTMANIYNTDILVSECSITGSVGGTSASLGGFTLGSDGIFKVANSCTSNNYVRVLTECDVGATCELKNKDSANVCLMFEQDNELNIYGNAGLWLNYRGTGSTVVIGNGSGLGCRGTLCAGVLSANNYTASPEYIASANNGGSWGGATAVFQHDASLPLTDTWYPVLSQCVCNGSYQFQIGWWGCEPDNWRIRSGKNGAGWVFKTNDDSFLSNVICTQTICFY